MSPPSPAPSYRVRRATSGDVAVIAHHRAAMFRDMGALRPADEPALEATSRTYLTGALAAGDYLGWLVEAGDDETRRARVAAPVVAGGGLLVFPTLPRPENLAGGREAYLLNIYTEPAHRRRGLARRLMDAMLGWCAEAGITRIGLHASDEGRPLYESLGFTSTNEMRLVR